MFADELKTLRRLGVRHVSRLCLWTCCRAMMGLKSRLWLPLLGAAADTQLRVCACVRAHDLERAGANYEHGVADCRRSEVRLRVLGWRGEGADGMSGCGGDTVARWNLRSTAGTCCS